MSFAKAFIIESICNNCCCSKTKAAEWMESVLETIKKSFESGEDVVIIGFGKFCVREKNERRGRNPATGEDLPLEARRVVTFRCSKVLEDRINERS